MPADVGDKWRDEDGPPSPQQDLTDWWEEAPPVRPHLKLTTYPDDHGEYLRELYDEILRLRAEVRELKEAASKSEAA